MADKYRFYAIAEANKEISKLEGIVAERDATLTAAQARITELETAASNKPADLSADLATAKQTISTLQGQAEADGKEIMKLKADLAASQTKADAAEKNASAAAAKIVASVGVPPVVGAPAANPAAEKPKNAISNLKGRDRVAAAIRAQMPDLK